MPQTQLCIRIPEQELAILNQYAELAQRTKTDIIREFIRSLAPAEESIRSQPKAP